jgi:hypothetical protein
MAHDDGVLDREKTATGRGGRLGRGGGRAWGTQGGQGGYGSPTQGDLSRLVQMLKRIRQSIDLLVHIEPRVVPRILHAEFIRNWPEVDRQFNRAIAYLTRPPSPVLLRQLGQAGLAGDMLAMKQTSLNYYLDHLDEAVRTYTGKPILTLPFSERASWLERIVKWFKPGCKTMNSVLGSLPKIIPGVEVAKEFKEHLEAAWDVVETAQEDREL